MFRHAHARYGGITPNSSGIITHAQDNSSRIEIGNKVYINANINPNETGTSTSFLAQRNNDSMSFSWNPMQVINLSRQQKAVCTREQNKLTTLERHFTRQSHLENFKQSCLIDKFRRRLERLNKLRSHVAAKTSIDTSFGGFPIENPPAVARHETASQSTNNTPIFVTNRNGLNKSAVKSDRFLQTINSGQTGKNKGVCDNIHMGNSKRYVKYTTQRLPGSQATGNINNYIYSGSVLSEHEINPRQVVDRSTYQRYLRTDKSQDKYNEVCETKHNESRKGVNENKSDLLTGRHNTLVNRNPSQTDNCDLATTAGRHSKTVRFQSDPVIDKGRGKLDAGEFRKLVQLSHSFRQARRK